MTYKIGLTGQIGSGKSMAADYFAKLGITIIDTDEISHQITGRDGAAIPQIIQKFGRNYISSDGTLNRAKMRELIFNNKLEKHKLESLLHPLIFDEVVVKLGQSGSIYTIIVVPLLFQSIKYEEYMDRKIFVDCIQDTVINRVIERNGWSREMVLSVLASQMSRLEQIKLADDILDNNKTRLDLELQVINLHKKYIDMICDPLLVKAGH